MSLVNLSLLKECFAHTKGRVGYQMGAKPALGSDSSTFDTADCSGWVRWALDRAGLTIPDGSATQHEFCKGRYASVPYAKAAIAGAAQLFIAFEEPTPIGHVWLGWKDADGVVRTHECHGGTFHRGVDSRPWNALASICAAVYELPTA